MITPDIYTALYDCFLQSDLFLRWLQPDCRAQLHLVGEPGSGKVSEA